MMAKQGCRVPLVLFGHMHSQLNGAPRRLRCCCFIWQDVGALPALPAWVMTARRKPP